MLLDADPARAFMPYPAAPVAHAADGPLSGLTFAVKDLFDVAGYPTSAGSPHELAMSGLKTATAPVVQDLLAAGARFVGKTITDELAFSLSGRNAHFGTPVNGGAPDRIPGGSSSGSAAAVSGGSCDFALGTDTGGSVRGPASHCGLFGIRPTHGRVNLSGCHDLAPSLDTGGVLAREGATFLRAAAVLLGRDPGPLPDRIRPMLAADAFGLLEEAAAAALAPALARVEAHLGPAEQRVAAPGGFEPLYHAFRRIQGFEAWIVDGPLIERYRPPLGPGVLDRFDYARTVTRAQWQDAEEVRRSYQAVLRDLLGTDGVLILPTMPDVAPLLTDSDEALGAYRLRALNLLCLSVLSGLPQVTMPLASRLGAPLGLSLLGPPGSDLGLVGLAVRIASGGPDPA